ncbi:hypothetical protein [Azospirillum sp. SYSU D00513]|uniref:hypothetical protein n=1 Tax=Azospirillum sp. SYSU D00513 TaxID=2812561 RepID=UPI001A971A93|nr:hypothetical protein [Azospirillum sp. SYSU D00513]
MPPDDLVISAERLLQSDDQNEADWRLAAHACYYAVYHVSARQFQLDPAGYEADHKVIRSRFKETASNPAQPRFIAHARRAILELWQLRRSADYCLDQPFTADQADRALQLAQGVVSAMPT